MLSQNIDASKVGGEMTAELHESAAITVAMGAINRVDIGQFHRLCSRLLNLFGQGGHLLSFLLVGWGHPQGQQVAQRVHCHVHFRAFLHAAGAHSQNAP